MDGKLQLKHAPTAYYLENDMNKTRHIKTLKLLFNATCSYKHV